MASALTDWYIEESLSVSLLRNKLTQHVDPTPVLNQDESVLKWQAPVIFMGHPNTLDLARTTLVVIDMQEAFRASILDFAETAANIALVTRAALLLKIPVIVTEQYPKGLGHTAEEIRTVLPAEFPVIEKTAFSSCGASEFNVQLEKSGSRQVLVCGIEAHICVNQTTHDLLSRGFQVHLLTDCVTARSPQNKKIGLSKMKTSGAIPSSIEMALFELMRDAKHVQFKPIQAMVKSRTPD